jgi:hypothetical protein
MASVRFNIEDPVKLLEEVKLQRSKLHFESLIEQCESELRSKEEEISRLQSLKQPFDVEITQLMTMRDRGFLDRFGYREMLEKFQPQQLEFKRKISTLQNECDLRNAQIKSYAEYVEPARTFLDYFESTVSTYSLVEIDFSGDQLRYLLTPDSVRRAVYSVKETTSNTEIELLATNSGLGSALLGQSVGQVKNSDYRFRNLHITKTGLIDDQTLHNLSDFYYRAQLRPTYRLQSRTSSSGGAVQRWRDGARSDSYFVCDRCSTLYFLGSRCEC